MSDNPFTAPHAASAPTAAIRATVAKSHAEIIGGARWFWWIAGLSLVNSIILHSGGGTSFVIGLGFTLVVDGIFQSLKPVAFAVDLCALGFFFAMGWYAARGWVWAFLTGIIFYALDAVIYLVFQDWMPAAFHGLALFYLFRGMQKLRAELKAAPAAGAEPPVATPAAGA
jgi:hypothetical protein